MALEELLSVKREKSKEIEVTPERIEQNLDKYRHIIAYWRMYPDKLIDYYCSLNPDNSFHFYWYQRLMLRAALRHKYTYFVFCRAYSKSFIGVLAMLLKGILYPGITMFMVAEGKQQSAEILSDKVTELCKLIPALSKEIVWDTRGTSYITRQTKDSYVLSFRNGSKMENIVAGEKTRGRRFISGNMEECVRLDQDMLQQVVIPTLNVPRKVNGVVDPNEVVNQSQSYVTSAGYKNTFSYDKLMETVCQSVAMPKTAFVLGGDFRVPIKFGAFDKNFLRDLRADGTFVEATFDREYKPNYCTL